MPANDAVTVALRGGPEIGRVAVATPWPFVVPVTLVPPESEKVTVRLGSTDEDRFGSVSVARTRAVVFWGAETSPSYEICVMLSIVTDRFVVTVLVPQPSPPNPLLTRLVTMPRTV